MSKSRNVNDQPIQDQYLPSAPSEEGEGETSGFETQNQYLETSSPVAAFQSAHSHLLSEDIQPEGLEEGEEEQKHTILSAKAPDQEPSAPPYEAVNQNRQGLTHLTYDQVVYWWNGLTNEQRLKMQSAGKSLTTEQIANLRSRYKQYYPKTIYPKKITLENQLSASDYYLIYYFFEDMTAGEFSWLDSDQFREAFSVPPPDEREEGQPLYEQAFTWWDNLTAEQQAKFKEHQFQNDQIRTIRREYAPYYRVYAPAYYNYDDHLDFFDYYLMCRYPGYLYGYPFYSPFYNDLLIADAIVRLARIGASATVRTVEFTGRVLMGAGRLVASGASATSNFLTKIGDNALSGGSGSSSSSSSSSSGSSSDDACKKMIGLAVIVSIIIAACSAVAGSIYAGIKTAASISDLSQGKKIARSLWRLTASIAGSCAGVLGGMIVGAALGSIIPGVGTVAGAVVGALFGAPIVAALASACAKYSAQVVSWWNHKDDPYVVSPTNPEKWDVIKTAWAFNANQVGMSTKEIHELFITLRNDKNKFKTIEGSLPGTSEYRKKNQYNTLLEAIKSGHDPRRGIRIDAHTLFTWNSREKKFQKPESELPALKGGLSL